MKTPRCREGANKKGMAAGRPRMRISPKPKPRMSRFLFRTRRPSRGEANWVRASRELTPVSRAMKDSSAPGAGHSR